ncbi:MAG TPA: alpha-2-macroglobulin family protein, partial [Puia sp.]
YTQSGEIAQGTVKTDAKGRFTIVFPATPDKTVSKNNDPIFTYNISADVTDINGETRSGSTKVDAGYKTLELSIDRPIGDALPADSLHVLVVNAHNLSGASEPALVNVTMYALKAPGRLIRERKWEKPDQFVMTRDEFLRNFPHDEYDDDANVKKWDRSAKVFEKADTAGRRLILPPDKPLSPGWYVMEASSKDKYGQPVKAIRYIHLYNGRTGYPGYPQYNWAFQDEFTTGPGEKVSIDIGSSAKDIFVIRNVGHISDRDSGSFNFFKVDNDKHSTEFPITEADRGGLGIYDAFVKDGRLYTRQTSIRVPWTNKELSIQYDTYRDKVLPGSEEKWKITIKGGQTDKMAAEVLAAMYDASLDQFKIHGWSIPDIYPSYVAYNRWNGGTSFSTQHSENSYVQQRMTSPFVKEYDRLIQNGYDIIYGQRVMLSNGRIITPNGRVRAVPGAMASYSVTGSDMYVHAKRMKKGEGRPYVIQVPDLEKDPDGSKGLTKDTLFLEEGEASQPITRHTDAPEPVQIRKNFNETAFFFPDLHTDDSGSVSFSFTVPEALTRWKAMILAHTKDLAFGYSEKSIVTQKQLMVQPNLPRFLREGDRMELGVKVVNLSDSEMTGQIELQLTDPTTGQTADGIFSNRQANQYFTVAAGQSSVVDFPIDIPYQYNRPLTYRIIARSKTYSDGEEAPLPVVSNRMLVTESLPLNMPGDGTKEFHFEKLLHSDSSETLNHHALTVEFTSNPAWYAVQALPYLMEYPYECAEQTFNRFYANALAATIIHSSPRIQAIFDKWRTTDTAALLSNLEKNQELKSVLLQETPWVLQGKSESQQKQHIALLFDMARMSRELQSSLTKIQQMQSPNGGFVWFKGGPDDRYITQYILTGIGRLQKLNAIPSAMTQKVQDIVKAALPYLDEKIKKDYEEILRQKKTLPPSKKIVPPLIGELPVDYLYMRSFFPEYGIPGGVLPAISYFRKQAQQQWLQYGKYMQGMIALALFRTGDVQTAKNIIASLKETAIGDEEKGMYWKGMEGGYYWWQAPIETQSLLIEAFYEIANAPKDEAALKTWLLRQKQTHSWPTTKATADACYALLMGSNWLTVERSVDIRLGNKTVSSGETTAEAGTGYFKQVVDGARVQPSMGNITVTMKTSGAAVPSALPAWGAVYWQYFENLDKITAADNTKAPLRLVKKLFIEKNTDRGPVLEPVTENGVLHPGDKVKVRIELRSDRDLEYVHMKDMRASCMEPVNVLSQYKWQGGLGYYQSTKDASTDFFFASLPKGTYVFEYPLFVGQKGNFSNGVTSIECMYAPEFGFHSEGIRVNVEEVTP